MDIKKLKDLEEMLQQELSTQIPEGAKTFRELQDETGYSRNKLYNILKKGRENGTIKMYDLHVPDENGRLRRTIVYK